MAMSGKLPKAQRAVIKREHGATLVKANDSDPAFAKAFNRGVRNKRQPLNIRNSFLRIEPIYRFATGNVLRIPSAIANLKRDQSQNIIGIALLTRLNVKDYSFIVIAKFNIPTLANATCTSIPCHRTQLGFDRLRKLLSRRAQHMRNEAERFHDK